MTLASKDTHNETNTLLDGVITFFASQQAVRADRLLLNNSHKAMLIPGPREISPNCGVALCFEFDKEKEITNLLNENKVIFERIHYYPEAKQISKWIE